jgi:hypothetical protein
MWEALMNKLTLLLLLPLTACNTPEQLAQLRADEAVRTTKEADAESACIAQGLGIRTQAFMSCVNARLHVDGLEIVRRDGGRIALLDLQSASFPNEFGSDARTAQAPVPLAPPVPSGGK